MDKNLEQVKEFHLTFGHPVRGEVTIPDEKESALMIRLLREELDELEKGIAEGNVVEMADGLGDLQILLNGAFLRCGLSGIKEKIMDAIQYSNMSKACSTVHEAQKAIDDSVIVDKEGEPVTNSLYYKEVNGKFVLYRTSDGKIMKGPNYVKPVLEHLVC
jgi:hypothetical protein